MSSNPLLDDIVSDLEAFQRERTRTAAAKAVAKLFPVPHGGTADLTPQWIPSHYELLKIEETCQCCGGITLSTLGIMFVENHTKTPSTVRKTKFTPWTEGFISGIPRRMKIEALSIPACASCLEDAFLNA